MTLRNQSKEIDEQKLAYWTEIVKNQQKYIYNLAYRLSGNQYEADDLTQETFLKAFEHLPEFRQEASIRTWLSRIATNTFLAKKRKKTAHKSITLEIIPTSDSSSNPEKVVIRRELQWCIHHILQQHLGKSHSVLLVLRDLNGFSYNEIAKMLNLSVSTVKSRLYRARKSYKDHLIKTGCAGLVDDYSCYCEGVRN